MSHAQTLFITGRAEITGDAAETDHVATAAGNRWPEALQVAFDLLPDPVFRLAGDELTFGDANRAACELFGYSREELRGMAMSQVCHLSLLADRGRILDGKEDGTVGGVYHTIVQPKVGAVVVAQCRFTPIPARDGGGWLVVAGESSTAYTRGLGLPGHDPLTCLPDRRLFHRLLERTLQRSRWRGDYLFGVCFIDLDGFKSTNDRFGHLIGDRVLCEIARRLVGCVRAGDMAARFGGDEFTVLIDDVQDSRGAESAGQRILEQIRRPVVLDDLSVRLSASVGLAVGPGEHRRAEDMLREADRAMYRVKSRGGDAVGFFDGGPSRRSAEPQ
ncbi:MAG: sensor domain-containing diguanylate cyclase [Pirellulales bacterium]|nr:sensor domain-containing diguanylate cyclase [Pirellulales bacterium]